MAGGLNDSPFSDSLDVGQFKIFKNARIMPDASIKKLAGRQEIQDDYSGTFKDFIIPPKRYPLATITEDNNAISFIYSGTTYLAVITPGDYYSCEDLAQAIEDALNAATGVSDSFALSCTGGAAPDGSAIDWVIGPKNGILDVALTGGETTVDVDLSATSLAFADWRTPGTCQVTIGSEVITYGGVTDLGSNKIRLTSATVTAAHSKGVDVIMHYSAASDAVGGHRETYGFIGSPSENTLDADGDGVDDTSGYILGD